MVVCMKLEQSAMRDVTAGILPARVPVTARAQLLALQVIVGEVFRLQTPFGQEPGTYVSGVWARTKGRTDRMMVKSFMVASLDTFLYYSRRGPEEYYKNVSK